MLAIWIGIDDRGGAKTLHERSANSPWSNSSWCGNTRANVRDGRNSSSRVPTAMHSRKTASASWRRPIEARTFPNAARSFERSSEAGSSGGLCPTPDEVGLEHRRSARGIEGDCSLDETADMDGVIETGAATSSSPARAASRPDRRIAGPPRRRRTGRGGGHVVGVSPTGAFRSCRRPVARAPARAARLHRGISGADARGTCRAQLRGRGFRHRERCLPRTRRRALRQWSHAPRGRAARARLPTPAVMLVPTGTGRRRSMRTPTSVAMLPHAVRGPTPATRLLREVVAPRPFEGRRRPRRRQVSASAPTSRHLT